LLYLEFLFDVVTIEASRSPGAAESAPQVFAHAAVLQCVARVEFDLQYARLRVVVDVAQFAGVDGFHFHAVREWKCPRFVAVLNANVEVFKNSP